MKRRLLLFPKDVFPHRELKNEVVHQNQLSVIRLMSQRQSKKQRDYVKNQWKHHNKEKPVVLVVLTLPYQQQMLFLLQHPT
jgi:hypothetical protein